MAKEPIKTISYVYKNGERVRVRDLAHEDKVKLADQLKCTYLNALYKGRAEFIWEETANTNRR